MELLCRSQLENSKLCFAIYLRLRIYMYVFAAIYLEQKSLSQLRLSERTALVLMPYPQKDPNSDTQGGFPYQKQEKHRY